MEQPPTFLVWLEWPERCFRVNAEALRLLGRLVPKGARIVRARSERAFLRELPKATHALVWSFNSEWFARAPRLRLLATPAAGRELVPEEGPRGVRIHYGHFHGPYIAESVLAFVFAWARGFFRPELKRLPWPRTEISDKCFTVAGTRAVIAGFGHIGRAIGRRLEENGVIVTGYTRHGLYFGTGEEQASFSTFLSREESGFSTTFTRALSQADWFVLALPSTTGTDDFLDAKLLSKLPRRCVVVNVGRGNAVDERMLCRALKTGRLAGAYLDVRRHEPSATVLEKPGHVTELGDLWNCVVMPHSSAFGRGYLSDFIDELAKEGLLE